MPKRLKFLQFTVFDPLSERFIPVHTGLGPKISQRRLAFMSEANPRLFNTHRAAESAILQYRRLNPECPALEIKQAIVGIHIS